VAHVMSTLQTNDPQYYLKFYFAGTPTYGEVRMYDVILLNVIVIVSQILFAFNS